jgi:hypothetical protein
MKDETNLLELDLAEPETTPEEPEKPKPAASAENPNERELRRALRDTRAALRQTTEALKYASEGRRAADKDVTEEPEKPQLSVDLVEAITNNDADAISKALREMGFVREGDVDGKITATRGQIARDKQLYDQYPDLEDEQSDLFKETARVYHELAKKDPALAKSGLLSEIAVELAEKRIASNGGRRAASDEYDLTRDVDDEDEDERERDRVERVRRQTGATGRRSSRAADRGGSDELDATQKTIVAKLKAAGADISEDGYRKRAQAGIRMSGLPTRRAR